MDIDTYEEEEEVFLVDCGNCGGGIDEEEYNRTGTDEYCENCPELECGDPRGHTFENCGCPEFAQ